MPRGPAKTPTNTLKVRGSWRAKTRAAEPEPAPQEPACPEWLSDEAKAEWLRVCDQLRAMNLLRAADQALLVAWCEAWGEFVDLTKEVASIHIIDAISTGVMSAKNKAAERLLKLAQQFGLSPAARARVGADRTAAKPKDNDKARFFGKSG